MEIFKQADLKLTSSYNDDDAKKKREREKTQIPEVKSLPKEKSVSKQTKPEDDDFPQEK